MSWITIFKKEMKDSLSKTMILTLVFIVLIGWLISLVLISVIPDSIGEDKAKIGIINLDGSDISNEVHGILATDADIVYPAIWDYGVGNGSELVELVEPNHSIEEAIERTRKNGGNALLIIEKGFGDDILNNSPGTIKIYWIVESYGVIDMVTSAGIMLLLDNLKLNMIEVLIPNNSIVNSTIIADSFKINETTILKGETFENTSVGEAVGFVIILQVVLPLFIIIFMIFMSASIMESIAKERRSDMLETLLSFPIKRKSILIGKVLSCIVSMFIVILILQGGGSMAYMSILSDGADSATSGNIRIGLSTIDYVMLMLIMLSGILCVLSLLTCSAMLTSTNTRSFISSLPSLMLFSIPTVILMIYDFSTLSLTSKIILSVIPGSHVGIAINSVVNGNYLLAISSITYLVLFALLVFYIVIKLFKSDRVVA